MGETPLFCKLSWIFLLSCGQVNLGGHTTVSWSWRCPLQVSLLPFIAIRSGQFLSRCTPIFQSISQVFQDSHYISLKYLWNHQRSSVFPLIPCSGLHCLSPKSDQTPLKKKVRFHKLCLPRLSCSGAPRLTCLYTGKNTQDQENSGWGSQPVGNY